MHGLRSAAERKLGARAPGRPRGHRRPARAATTGGEGRAQPRRLDQQAAQRHAGAEPACHGDEVDADRGAGEGESAERVAQHQAGDVGLPDELDVAFE